jgi:hypothetical protein
LQTWLALIDGREAEAEISAAHAAKLCKHLNQPWIDGFCRMCFAFSHVFAARHEQAMLALGELIETFERASDRHMRMFPTIHLGIQQFLTGELVEARRNVLSGLNLAWQIANSRAFTGVCEFTAYFAAREGDAELAARLMGAAENGRITTGAPLFPNWAKPHDVAWDEICARLGATAANKLFDAGKLAGPRECVPLAAVYLQSPAPRL